MANPALESAPAEGTRAIHAAFLILDAISLAPTPPRMTDIVRAVELPKSSVFRLLRALEGEGAVRRSEHDRRYRLGRRFDDYARVSRTPLLASRFHDLAVPALRPLNETAQFGILSGRDVTFVTAIDSTQLVRLVTHPGRTLPAHASATGKAILAFADPASLETVLAGGLPRITDRTITDPEMLRDELDTVRRNGYATESEESTPNLSCLAAPVWGAAREVVGAITVCIPRAPLPAERMPRVRDAVLDAARRMSATS